MRSMTLPFRSVFASAVLWTFSSGCCGAIERRPAGALAGANRDGACDRAPYIAGDYVRVFVPSGTRYVNDHTVVMGPDGSWHVFGITDASDGSPDDERAFLHATAPSLLGPWTEHPDALVADAASGEEVLWAPFVLERSPGRWSMFYYADRLGADPMRGSRRADSSDLWHWTRVPAGSPGGRAPGGRDPFVLRDGSRFLLYSVGVGGASQGEILVSEGRDPELARWSPAVPALTDPDPADASPRGNVQSPYVVKYAGAYYLFVTRKSASPIDYARTSVFCSEDPLRFAWQPVADLRAHAAELIVDRGRWFITSAGWTKAIGDAHRGLSIAPLGWAAR